MKIIKQNILRKSAEQIGGICGKDAFGFPQIARIKCTRIYADIYIYLKYNKETLLRKSAGKICVIRGKEAYKRLST